MIKLFLKVATAASIALFIGNCSQENPVSIAGTEPHTVASAAVRPIVAVKSYTNNLMVLSNFSMYGNNAHLFTKKQNADYTWPSTWYSNVSVMHGVPAAMTNGTTLYLFNYGTDNKIYYQTQTSTSQSYWTYMGGPTNSDYMAQIKVAQLGNTPTSPIVVFAVVPGGTVQYNIQNSNGSFSSSNWGSFLPGNYFNYADPQFDVNTQPNGDIVVVVRDPVTGNTRYATLPTSRTPSQFSLLCNNLPTAACSDIVVAKNQDGRLEVFVVRQSDYNMWHCWQSAANSSTWNGGWESMGAVYVGGNFHRFAAATATGRIELVYPDYNTRTLRHCYQVAPNSSWSGPADFENGTFPTDDFVTVNVASDNKLYAFAFDNSAFTFRMITQSAPGSGWLAPVSFGTY